MTRPLVALAVLVVLVGGCAATLSPFEVSECRQKVQDLMWRKGKQVEIMNTTPWDSLDHRFAYVHYRLLALEMQPLYHESKAACWGVK